MRLQIRPEKTYTLSFGNWESSGWAVESRWEGMTKLTKGGRWIILLQCEGTEGFAGLLSEVFDREPYEISVVCATQSLIDEILEAA